METMNGFLRLFQCNSLFVSLLVFWELFLCFASRRSPFIFARFLDFFHLSFFPFFSSFVFPLFCFVFGFFRIGTTCFCALSLYFRVPSQLFLVFAPFGLAKCPLLLRSRKSLSRKLRILRVYPLPEGY